jgi:SAM-dependent methyltransferase
MNYDGPRTLVNSCWCGSQNLAPFAPRYVACQVCGTLILSSRPPDSFYEVHGDDKGFYSQQYWTRHQQEAHSLPDIHVRARNDLADRCIYWLDHVLQFERPPARVMDFGCAHGGFVYLLQQAGFDAVGLELSPWVSAFARDHFGVEVRSGTLTDAFPDSHFDVIGMFDVLEHVLDPVGALKVIRERLGREGIVFVQTPCYRDEGPTWSMLLDPEHTYLFNRASVERLFRVSGFNSLSWRPALFPTDMFFVASPKEGLAPLPPDELSASKPMIEAMLTLGAANRMLVSKLAESDADRAARLEAIERLNRALQERLEDIEHLNRALQERLEDIERLDRALQERLEDIERLDRALQELKTPPRGFARRAYGRLMRALGKRGNPGP